MELFQKRIVIKIIFKNQYDLEHRLIRYSYHNQNSNEHQESHYQYDPFGRRIKKSIKDNDTKNEKNYWYGWDGDRLVTTETENQRINTIYHPNGFEPLVRIEQALPLTPKVKTLGEVMEDEIGMKLPKLVTDQFNAVEEAIRKDQLSAEQIQWLEGMMLNQESISEYIPKHPKQHPLQIHYYHCDQVGTPLALISDTGTIDWAIELDPFGNVLAENGSDKIYQPIRMQGQQYDEETGLHYNRYRYYDPQVGRYISQDPIGLAGGMNNYIYPLNPNQAVDPRGLLAWFGIPIYYWLVGGGVVAAGTAVTVSNVDTLPAPGGYDYDPLLGIKVLGLSYLYLTSRTLTCSTTETETKKCPPCNPPAGEKYNKVTHFNSHNRDGDPTLGSHGCEQKTGSPVHWHYSVNNQNPKTCDCFEVEHNFGGCGVAPP